MSEKSYDLLVIGGGPAGASTAYWAAKAGLHTAIIEKKVCLQKRICHKLAPSKDFTITPPKLKHKAPNKTKTVPGILFNSVN